VPSLVVIFSSLVLSAASSSPLQDAQQAFEGLEFDRAEKLYKQALNAPGSRAERITAYRGLALAHAFQGEVKQAKRSFELLLLLDPEAKVDITMGPKISKPFKAAKKGLGDKRNTLLLERQPEGSIAVRLFEEVPLVSQLLLYTRERGTSDYTWVKGSPSQPLAMTFPIESSVEAYVEGLDDNGGILYSDGSSTSPRVFLGTGLVEKKKEAREADEPREPVAKEAREPRKKELAEARPAPMGVFGDEDEPKPSLVPSSKSGRGKKEPEVPLETIEKDPPRSYVPFYVGAAAVIGAGIAVGLVLANPGKITLPNADRTGRLP
jgi:tetratricopeptide (TPR) repeat protein